MPSPGHHKPSAKSQATSRWINPPFDPRLLGVGSPTIRSKHLRRGGIVCDSGVTGMSGRGVKFLYNPISVAASHTVDWANTIDQGASQPSSVPTQAGTMVNIGSVGVDLLYDRTYELWDSSKKNTLAGQYGVYADVMAFYRLLGVITQGIGYADNGSGGIKKVAEWNVFPTQPIQSMGRYYLYIGDKVRYYGMITDFSVTYSHFAHNMVPMRASVSLSLQFQNDMSGSPSVQGGVKKHTKGGIKPPPSTQPHPGGTQPGT